MAYANLNRESQFVDDGLESIVIVKELASIPGGRTLDVSGVSADTTVIKAGHILIQNTTTKEISPLGVNDNAFVALPSGYSYYGVLKASVLVKDAQAAIMTMGMVNAAACPCTITSAIVSGLPHIQFINL